MKWKEQHRGAPRLGSITRLIVGHTLSYAFNANNWCYEFTRGKIIKTGFERGLQTTSPRFREIWMLITGFTPWYVWKVHCLKVFQYLVSPGGSDHGYMVHDYQLPPRAFGRGLQPLQRRGHCSFVLLAKMAEHADGDARRIRPEMELPAPTLVVSYSPPTLPLM